MADVKGSYALGATDGMAGGLRGGKTASGRATADVSPPNVYKMRGRDDGRTPGSDYIIWTSTGSEADFAGAGFSGGSPTPIGSLIAASVVLLDQWIAE